MTAAPSPVPGFSNDFRWGAATAAYQIEGGAEAGGRGASVWDMLCRQPGRIYEGHTGAVACDHFGRWKEDIRIMKAIGLKAYRFSVAWPRVIPDGDGAVNPEGLAFYDRLVDGLLEAGIAVVSTTDGPMRREWPRASSWAALSGLFESRSSRSTPSARSICAATA